MGRNVHSDRRFEFDRWVGDEGVIAVGQHGVVMSVPNADASSLVVAPYSNDASEHEARVLRYFIDAGIPQEQIGETHTNTMIKQEGFVTDLMNGSRPKPSLLGHYTVIDRQIDGIRIAGSHAWARFNANDEVVAEEVFWPELPGSLVDEAKNVKKTLPAIADKMPRNFGDRIKKDEGEVAIHHSPHFQTSFETFVSVDFQSDSLDSSAPERRFGADGIERRFAYEEDASVASDTK